MVLSALTYQKKKKKKVLSVFMLLAIVQSLFSAPKTLEVLRC